MAAAIERCGLDLSGYAVLTEAASGAYVVTPVLAAMAGARKVTALTRSTRYGTAAEITANTMELAGMVGVADRIEVREGRPSNDVVADADIITNSGHVRPIDAAMISRMKPTAVIPLMYESWEFRAADLDLSACRDRGIRITGTNERHEAVDVFSFLGIMAVKLLVDAGVSVYTSRLMLVCDNPFAPFIQRGLTAAGASVDLIANPGNAPDGAVYDGVVVSRTPSSEAALTAAEIATIKRRWPGAVVAVYWGDLDRATLREAGLTYWPPEAPHAGHMGILPSGVGPEPIIRLQSGSLKAAEAMLRHAASPQHPAHAFGQPF
jgi:hypothetical protein